ncbi:branched-chain amino acid ABC transporter permease [Nakamurella lactea]|uniref:branched-chain amino acid ABC transporter permease n=1 Tax=Nakamurella lactea TaxID=459515 RepID=UPI0003FBCD5B|nr:branched-chain amino acid ABC transporter permease [Nakamurella lactea]
MDVAAQTVWGSIVTGALYALVGVGFVLLYRSSKVLSFCQGGFMLLGAFIFYDLVTYEQLNWILAAAIVAVVVGAFSALMYVGLFSRTASGAPFVTSVATIGLAGVLQAAVSIKYGTSALPIGDVVSGYHTKIAGATITAADLAALALPLLVFLGLALLLKRSRLGLQMNAVADNPALSVHLGVSAARIATIAWALAGFTAALAGVAFALRFSVDPSGVANVGLYAFPAIIIGGLDSISGAVFGGFVLGFLQITTTTVLGADWVTIVIFGVLLLFLMFRPTGLFGKAEVVRL